MDDHDGALLAATLTAELRLQPGNREVAATRDEMAGIQAMSVPTALAERPQEPTCLHGMAQGLDRPDPMPNHENN